MRNGILTKPKFRREEEICLRKKGRVSPPATKRMMHPVSFQDPDVVHLQMRLVATLAASVRTLGFSTISTRPVVLFLLSFGNWLLSWIDGLADSYSTFSLIGLSAGLIELWIIIIIITSTSDISPRFDVLSYLQPIFPPVYIHSQYVFTCIILRSCYVDPALHYINRKINNFCRLRDDVPV